MKLSLMDLAATRSQRNGQPSKACYFTTSSVRWPALTCSNAHTPADKSIIESDT